MFNGEFPSGFYDIDLAQGEKISVEVQFSTMGRTTSQVAATLKWAYASYAMAVIPSSAFVHEEKPMCLTHKITNSYVHLSECIPGSRNQRWRLDGGYIRPSHELFRYTNTTGEPSTMCLRAKNRPWRSDYSHLTTCNEGGWTWEEIEEMTCSDNMPFPNLLWTIGSDGTIRSDSTRPDVGAMCRDVGCTQDRLYCAFVNAVAPHMCLSSGTQDSNMVQAPTLEECSTKV